MQLRNHTGTNIAYSLGQTCALKLGSGGDGYAANRRKSYVVLVSEGIENKTYAITSATRGVTDTLIVDQNFVATTPSVQFSP